MDMHAGVTTGQDPLAWLKKLPGCLKLCPGKDPTRFATEKDSSCTLGEGSIDHPASRHAARNSGPEYFIVEQEKYAQTTPRKSGEANSAYLRNLRF